MFAEHISPLACPHVQRTVRLQVVLHRLGMAVGGKAGARLAEQLGMSTSADSLLRLIPQAEPSTSEPYLDSTNS
jgi:hypothetical protein